MRTSFNTTQPMPSTRILLTMEVRGTTDIEDLDLMGI